MTHPIYSAESLSKLNRNQLWQICEQRGLKKYPASATCIQAILDSQPQKVEQDENERGSGRTLLPLTTREITFYNHELLSGDKIVAFIDYDDEDFVTQPWVVTVGGEEWRRCATYEQAENHVRYHYLHGTLPSNDVAVAANETGNEVNAQVSAITEEFGLELLDNGIYDGDIKLGEVGYKNGWWVKREASTHGLRIPCDSAADAVLSLYMLSRNHAEQTTTWTFGSDRARFESDYPLF